MMVQTVAVLGSTGSIGRSTLDVIDRLPGRFRIKALAAGSNLGLLRAQIEKYRPELVSVLSGGHAAALRRAAAEFGCEVVDGPEAAAEVARSSGADIVVSAITGFAGLKPTLEAVRAGARVALANKEALVAGGDFLRREARRSGARIIPVDSEHSGVFQCLAGRPGKDVRRVILTASGGPFFRTPLGKLGRQRVKDVLRHPTWKMGRKITVDSATLMNKGLELIEARWLFGLDPSELGVLIHPQSVVHSLVEFEDGSLIAQLGAADMRLPIQYALTYPERLDTALPRLDLAGLRKLEFFEVDERRFPLFGLARRALEAGGSAPVVLNAANETAVTAFLEGRLGFVDIAGVVRSVVEEHEPRPVSSLEEICEVDASSRRRARAVLSGRSGGKG
jgi:1-deoxy-D-xylulose-5-phosphate reductoisomerase